MSEEPFHFSTRFATKTIGNCVRVRMMGPNLVLLFQNEYSMDALLNQKRFSGSITELYINSATLLSGFCRSHNFTLSFMYCASNTGRLKFRNYREHYDVY